MREKTHKLYQGKRTTNQETGEVSTFRFLGEMDLS